MAKKQKIEDNETTLSTHSLDELALGVCQIGPNQWAVARIAYNSHSGEATVEDVELAGSSREDAIELFKITAVEEGIV
jgi:hypothetical protein